MGEFDKYREPTPEQPAPETPANGDDFFFDPEQQKVASSEDEFVIGGGFDMGVDYEGQVRRNRGQDKPPVIKQRPLSQRDTVDLRQIQREEQRDKKRAKRPRRFGLKTFLWVALIVVTAVVLSLGIITGFTDLFALGKDHTCVVVIEEGMTTAQIADLLKEEGAIDHPLLFRAYLKFKKQDGTLRHGAYQFNASKGYEGIVDILQKGNEKETVSVRIPEATDVRGIIKLLEENHVCTSEQFRRAMKKDIYNYDFVKAIPTEKVYYRLEGYLYPDTYEFFTGETEENAEFAIDRMLANFQSHLNDSCPDYKEKLSSLREYGISDLHDALTLASILQLECDGYNDEMANCAAVYLGRLVWNEPHYLGATASFYYPDNRYNTNNYALYGPDGNLIAEAGYEGLPPGPQSCVSITALKAVLNPNTDYIGQYYYYVTDSNHEFHYNKTYSQHKRTIDDLIRRGMWIG